MTHTATLPARGFTLKQLLMVDALTCLVTGLLLVAAAEPLAALLGLPRNLLFYAGVALFPCAVLMTAAARTGTRALAWLVIVGNFAWALASVGVALALSPTATGLAFILLQAAVVAILGWLEARAR
jgi:hypothetical protein